MMFHYDYKTQNTCSQIISLDLDGDVVHNISLRKRCGPHMMRNRLHNGDCPE